MLTRALLASALGAAAQTAQPRVELRLLADKKQSSLPVGAVGVGNCFSPVALREMTEVASLTVSVNGPWERSAEHLAKQKAAEAGANCLHPLSNYGPEEDHYPIVRQYRAFLVTTSATTIDGTFRFPAPPRTFEPPPPPAPLPAAAAAPARQANPVGEDSAELLLAPPPDGGDSLWISGPHILDHEITLDPGKMTQSRWESVRKDFKKYFPARAVDALEKARGAGLSVVVDLRRKTVEPLDGER